MENYVFCAESAWIFHLSVKLAAQAGIQGIVHFTQDHPDTFDLVEWVLFDEETWKAYEEENRRYTG